MDDGEAGFKNISHALENFLDFIAEFGGVGDVGHQSLFGFFEALRVVHYAGSAVVAISSPSASTASIAD